MLCKIAANTCYSLKTSINHLLNWTVPEQGSAQIRHRLLTVSDSVSESGSDTAP